MRKILLLFMLVFSGSLFAQNCVLNKPVTIKPQGITEVTFNIQGLINDDLSDPLQSVCKVSLGFSHKSVSTLEIELISPDGQSVKLVGPGNTNLGTTQFIDWNVTFIGNNYTANPDSTFGDVWENSNAWEAFNVYDGRYLPHQGSFDDFNTGSANGVWRLRMEDSSEFGNGILKFANIQFCDFAGSNCQVCYAEAGSFQNIGSNIFCSNDPILSNEEIFEPLGVNTSFSLSTFNYALIQNDEIISFGEDLAIAGLAPGEYRLCGVVNFTSDQAQLEGYTNYQSLINALGSGTFCGDAMENCFDLIIEEPAEEETVSDMICGGEVITIDGINFYQETDTIVYQYNLGSASCERAIRYIINERIVEAEITSASTEIGCNGSLF